MTENATITLSYAEPDVAVLTSDTPGRRVNLLSWPALQELSDHLDQLELRDGLAGLVLISGKAGTFCVGADLGTLAESPGISTEEKVSACRRGQSLLARLSTCPFVTVAAIDGVCVGGGAELASWCDRRVLSDNPRTKFGFPEVKLGLIPGWGGTVRAPRIVGLGNAIQMITDGEPIGPVEASVMGWASDVVPADRLVSAAITLIRDEQRTRQFEHDRQRWGGSLAISATEVTFLATTARVAVQRRTKGHNPGPAAALEVMLDAARLDSKAACQAEAETMARLRGSPVNAALLNVFFLTDRNRKDSGVTRDDITPAAISTVGIIGAGTMGTGIAAANVKRDIHVNLTDVSTDALQRGHQRVLKEVSYDKQTRGPDAACAVKYAPFIDAAASDAAVGSCDLIIEAVVEDITVKNALFARLEPLIGSQTILASNTSTISITQLAADLSHPERFCGIHFFNPVRRMKLVEIVRSQRTSDETVATAVAYAKRIGKSPIVVNDGPGFLVNRVLLPYMTESLLVLEEGAEIEQVERVAREFGMPVGPFALHDIVGLDTALHAGRILCDAFSDRFSLSPILPALVKAGRLGPKSGVGFFAYKNKTGRARPDPGLKQHITPYLRADARTFTDDELTCRLFLPMLVEATRVLEDAIVREPRDVDLGLVLGIGFPAHKGGLLFWADTFGSRRVVELLKPLEPLGQRYRATDLLVELAKAGRKFYDL